VVKRICIGALSFASKLLGLARQIVLAFGVQKLFSATFSVDFVELQLVNRSFWHFGEGRLTVNHAARLDLTVNVVVELSGFAFGEHRRGLAFGRCANGSYLGRATN
jgi:hypothetical protein